MGAFLRLLAVLLVFEIAAPARGEVGGAPRPLILEAIVVRPAGGVEEAVVRRLLPVRPGDPIDAEGVLSVRGVLERSGSFRSVEAFTSRGTVRGTVVLEIEADLDHTAQFETGFGHDARRGWYLNLLGVRWNSPYRTGGSVRFGARLGQRLGEFYFETERPALGNGPFALQIQGTSGGETWLVQEGADLKTQQIARGRLRAGLEWKPTRTFTTTFWAGAARARPEATLDGRHGVPDEPAGRLVPVPQNQTYREIALESVWDHTDPLAPWRRGAWVAARVQASDPTNGKAFVRADFEARGALPLPAHAALAWRGRAEFADPGTPYHWRSVTGGTGSVRGFRDASLSGPLGARAAWLASGELRVPLAGVDRSRPRVTGLVFVDVGEHWDAAGQRAGTAVGIGYGMRVGVPWVQVLGLDVGVPMTTNNTGDPFWVHGSLGFSF